MDVIYLYLPVMQISYELHCIYECPMSGSSPEHEIGRSEKIISRNPRCDNLPHYMCVGTGSGSVWVYGHNKSQLQIQTTK